MWGAELFGKPVANAFLLLPYLWACTIALVGYQATVLYYWYSFYVSGHCPGFGLMNDRDKRYYCLTSDLYRY